MKRYIWNLLRAGDVFFNTLIGGKLRTVSARLGEGEVDGSLNWLEAIVHGALESYWPGHCRESWEHWKAFTSRSGEVYELYKLGQILEGRPRSTEDTPAARGPTTRNTGGSGN